MNTVESLDPIAVNIRAARETVGFSQEALGRLVGVRRTRINDWENGRHQPSREHLDQLAQILGRTRGWFYDPHDEEAG